MMFSMHSIPAKPETAWSEGSLHLQVPATFLIVYHTHGEFKVSFRTPLIFGPLSPLWISNFRPFEIILYVYVKM